MSRTVSTTVASAIAQTATQPVYLINMGWDAGSPDPRYIATWSSAITWNGLIWAASGATVTGLNMNGGSLRLPTGDADPWLNLVVNQGARGRAISIYEHHTDLTASPQTDAELLFTGIMDTVSISRRGIDIDFIESLRNKSFPTTSIDPWIYTYLLSDGDRIYWGPDIVKVQ